MSLLRAVFFDLDGTLIDTERLASAAILQCFSDWNVSFDPTVTQYITGRTWENAFGLIFKSVKLPISESDAARIIIETYRKKLETEALEVPGAVQAVRALHQEGVRLAVVSGSHRREIETALKKLKIDGYFEFYLGAEDYPLSKPAPDGYQKALQMMGLEASNVLIFEDSTAGIASARDCGIYVIAISCTNHFQQDQSLADDHIEDLRAITPEWVRDAMGKASLQPTRYALDPAFTDPVRIKKERQKARALKLTSWWKQKVGEGICHYCHQKFKPSELTLDHIVAVARGGQSVKSNCVPACKACNQSKKLDTPAELLLKESVK